MNKIFFVIGASGAGKTTAVKNIEKDHPDKFNFCYFDTIGVPSDEEMVKQFGSAEEWQRVTTEKWVRNIKDKFVESKTTILDGQTRPSFIDEACAKAGVTNYEVILFDCSDEERKQRLVNRGHPELANEQMMNWAQYLRNDSNKRGYELIDNTNMTQEESKSNLLALLNR